MMVSVLYTTQGKTFFDLPRGLSDYIGVWQSGKQQHLQRSDFKILRLKLHSTFSAILLTIES